MTEIIFGRLFGKIIGNEMTQLMSNDPKNGYAESMGGDDTSIGANLTAIWESWTDYNVYQIIFTKINPIQHVEEYFDIGICKAYCDGKKIRYTKISCEMLQTKLLLL